jgi:hypothetical protein
MTHASWTKEADGRGNWIHWLGIDTENTIKIERSAGGDYFVCVYTDGEVAGGEVEYKDTLKQAKKLAESWLATGDWRGYLFSESAA